LNPLDGFCCPQTNIPSIALSDHESYSHIRVNIPGNVFPFPVLPPTQFLVMWTCLAFPSSLLVDRPTEKGPNFLSLDEKCFLPAHAGTIETGPFLLFPSLSVFFPDLFLVPALRFKPNCLLSWISETLRDDLPPDLSF